MSERTPKHLSCPIVVLRILPETVTGDAMADELRDELLALYLSAHAQHVVLDFEGVRYLSSAGFRPLLRLNRQVRERGGRLVLCQLSPEIREIFTVTRLISNSRMMPATFEVQPDVASAVANLLQTPPEKQDGTSSEPSGGPQG
jgi:anti-anti-sigma factor